jgi:chromosome segregation ATPase
MDSAVGQLEGRGRKAADALKRLRQENRALNDEVGRLRPRVQELEKTAAGRDDGASAADAKRVAEKDEEIRGLRSERDEVRRRIAKLVQVLDGLDAQE